MLLQDRLFQCQMRQESLTHSLAWCPNRLPPTLVAPSLTCPSRARWFGPCHHGRCPKILFLKVGRYRAATLVCWSFLWRRMILNSWQSWFVLVLNGYSLPLFVCLALDVWHTFSLFVCLCVSLFKDYIQLWIGHFFVLWTCLYIADLYMCVLCAF